MSKKLETETGEAILYKDGSMKVDNSGYIQKLTKLQVGCAWAGEPIPIVNVDWLVEIAEDNGYDTWAEYIVSDDYSKDDIILAEVDNCYDWYNFQDECHCIPQKKEFG